MAESAPMRQYRRSGAGVKKHTMSGYKFKNVGSNRGPAMDGKEKSKRYGQKQGKASPSNRSVHG